MRQRGQSRRSPPNEQRQTRQELTESLERSLPVPEQQVEDLRAIDAPEAQEERYQEAIGLVEAQVAVYQRAISDLEAGVGQDVVADELRTELEASAERLNGLVVELRLPTCDRS